MVLDTRLTASAPDLHALAAASLTSEERRRSRQSSRSVPVRRNSLAERGNVEFQNSINATPDRLEGSADHGSWTDVHASPPEPAPRINDDPHTDLRQLVERLEHIRRERSRQRNSRTSIRGLWNGARGFFGFGPEGSVARKELVSLITKLVFGMSQIAAVICLLVLGSLNKGAQPEGGANEWVACGKPLGPWCIIWAVRVVAGSIIAVWAYRTRPSRPRRNRPPPAATQPNPTHNGLEPRGDLPAAAEAPPQQAELRPPTPAAVPPRRSVPTRLGSFLSIISTCWFVVAHVLVYTTINTCRYSAPHIWWLTFGIICIGYLVILELVIVILVVFFLTPICILLINVVLVCMGREPIRYPLQTQHEIGKLSSKAVDRIPLVLYIPAPVPKQGREPSAADNVPVSAEAARLHTYPPQTEGPPASPLSSQSHGTRVQSRSRRWFTFRRLRRKSSVTSVASKDKNGKFSTDEYEDKWEKGDYPFVKLEDNRATCAICLCDFEEPKRVRYSLDSRPAPDTVSEEKQASNVDVEQGRAEEVDGELRLENPGEGAQPLRLLGCAHVFHKTCIDPWLTEVSGRCPVCQRPVEIDNIPKKRRRES